MLIFRSQKLTPEQQIAFARRFGDLEISPRTPFALPGHPEILVLSNIVVDGKPIGNAEAGRTWHTDMSYTQRPPRGSMLYAHEIPVEEGRALGDTVFASAAAAYKALPAEPPNALVGLRAIHRAGAKKYAPGSKLADTVKDMPDVEHPVIRTHPVTGRKAIYVREGECVGIRGMPEAERLPLIKELSEMVTREEYSYRHSWRVGDLLMSDNGMTQHLAISDYAVAAAATDASRHRQWYGAGLTVACGTPRADRRQDQPPIAMPAFSTSRHESGARQRRAAESLPERADPAHRPIRGRRNRRHRGAHRRGQALGGRRQKVRDRQSGRRRRHDRHRNGRARRRATAIRCCCTAPR